MRTNVDAQNVASAIAGELTDIMRSFGIQDSKEFSIEWLVGEVAFIEFMEHLKNRRSGLQVIETAYLTRARIYNKPT